MESEAETEVQISPAVTHLEESLPSTPSEALTEIKSLSLEFSNVFEKASGARLAFVVLEQIADRVEEDVEMEDALKWLAVQGRDSIKEIEENMNRIRDIANKCGHRTEPDEA